MQRHNAYVSYENHGRILFSEPYTPTLSSFWLLLWLLTIRSVKLTDWLTDWWSSSVSLACDFCCFVGFCSRCSVPLFSTTTYLFVPVWIMLHCVGLVFLFVSSSTRNLLIIKSMIEGPCKHQPSPNVQTCHLFISGAEGTYSSASTFSIDAFVTPVQCHKTEQKKTRRKEKTWSWLPEFAAASSHSPDRRVTESVCCVL